MRSLGWIAAPILGFAALTAFPRIADAPQAEIAAPPPPTALGCFREGRFLNFDESFCFQVGGVMRPRKAAEEEIPKARPSIPVEAAPLDPL